MDQQNVPAQDLPSQSLPQSEPPAPVKPDYFSFNPVPPKAAPPVQSSPGFVSNSVSSAPIRPPIPTPTYKPVSPPAPVSATVLPKKKPNLKLILLIMAIIILVLGMVYLIKIISSSTSTSSQTAIFSSISTFVKGKLPIKKTSVTITYWGLFEPSSAFQQVIADYEKDHPGVKINYVQENLKLYRERLQAALERKEGPDIFRIHQTWVPMFGSLLSAVPQTTYNNSTFEKTFYPSAKESLKYNGQYVAIPLMVDGLSLFYNEDIFKAKGKVPPTTWGELKKAACELTVKDEQGKIRTAGVALGTTNNIDHWSDILGLMMLQNSANLANPAACSENAGGGEGSQTCLGRDALTFYTLFISDKACADEGVNVGAVWNSILPTSTYSFATGSLAMYFGPSWRAFDIKSINDKLNFKIVSVPQLPGGVVNWSSYWAEAVSKDSKYQAEAWEFLQYLSSDKVLQKLYQTESSLRLFGEPYSRVDMAAQLQAQPMVGPFVEQAPFAKSWYLSSNTFDNGINEQIIKYYEDAVNAVNKGTNPLSALSTATQGVTQVLRKYGLAK